MKQREKDCTKMPDFCDEESGYIYIEFSIVFDNDYDVEQISDLIGIKADDYMNKNKTRINPITKESNPGYWSIKSNRFSDMDIEHPINDIMLKLENRLEDIKNISIKEDGELFFDVVIYFAENEVPIINLDKDFLKMVNYLDAEIRFDMYRI